MRNWWVLLLPSLVAPLWAAGQAFAQEPASPGTDQLPSAVEEVKPSGFYLRNEKGELVYVPDISYEQFEQMLKIQRNLANPQRPAFIMTDMAMDASVVGNRLELDVEFTLQGRILEGVEAGTWFHVPLHCDNAVLRKEPAFNGPGGHFLTFDSAQDGYVCWLQMGGEATHKAILHLLVPVEQVGHESHVTISAPSPLASTLRLRVPEKSAQGVIGDVAGAAVHPLAFESTAEGQGQFVARGIRGNVVLNWHASQAAEEPVDPRLDVRGAITVTVDEMLQEVSAEGRFQVRGFSGPIDSFRVRLPPGMRLRESPEPGYQVRALPPEDPATTPGQVVEVHLDRPSTSKNIHLMAEVPTTQDDPARPLTVARLIDQSEEFEPARFEFAGAVRHRGHIDFVIHGDWALEDPDDPEFPRVDWAAEDPDDPEFPPVDPAAVPAGPNAVAARFRYHNQERALKVSIRQKATWIRVEPTYQVSVDSQQARLLATLVCSTSGSKAAPLAIRLPFWTVEIVRFVGFDSALPMELTETNPLVVPIPVAAQAKRKFTLEIEARLDLTASVVSGTGPLRVVLPLLEATNPSRANVIVSPATVTMIPADNILLTPRPQQMKALSALVTASTVAGASPSDGPANTQMAGAGTSSNGGGEAALFCYRDRGSSEQAVFFGDIKIQPQVISVTVASTATLSRTAFSIEQRLSYIVLHEPVETLMFTLPVALAGEAGAGWRLSLADQPLIPSIEPGVGSERPRARVRLPQPMLGPLELRVVHTRQPMPELSNAGLAKLSIPLVFPATRNDSNTTVVDNTLTVLQEDHLHVEPASGVWVVAASESGAGKLVLVTSAEGADPVLQLSLRGSSPAGTTVAHQIWIQSWLTNQQRRDRAVFKVSTSEPQLSVTLPQLAETEVRLVKVAVDQLDVAVDGPGPRGVVSVPIPRGPQAAVQEHVVELWYDLLAPGHLAYGPLSLTAATLDAQDRVDRMYWQVILPRGEVVVSRDSRLSAELQWQWDQFGWRRYPSQEQADLEQWIGASRQEPVPTGTNEYLFTTFGATSQLELTTASRSLILLVCSGMSLVGGLVLLYFPVLRHPALLLAAGIVTATLGLLLPELAILFAQAALLGMLLAWTARVFRQWLWQSRAVPPTVQGRTQFSDSKIKVTETVQPRADGSSRITATSPPASVSVSAADSKL